MLDAANVQYALLVTTPSGERVFLTDFIRQASWEENDGELAARLEVQLHNQPLPQGGYVHELTPLNAPLTLLAHWGLGWKEVFTGRVMRWNYRNDGLGASTLLAYDQLITLFKSEDDRFYPGGTTAKAVILDLAQDWGIPLGQVAGPNTPLSKQMFRGCTVAQMLHSVLTEAQDHGSGRWFLRSTQGKLEVLPAGQNQVIYHFGADNGGVSAEEDWNIEKLVTRVQVVGAQREDARAKVLTQMDGNTSFGTFQKLVYSGQHDSLEAANQAAQEILKKEGQPQKTRKILAADLPCVRKGDQVHIAGGTILGYFVVTGIRHDLKRGTMQMEVEDLAL